MKFGDIHDGQLFTIPDTIEDGGHRLFRKNGDTTASPVEIFNVDQDHIQFGRSMKFSRAREVMRINLMTMYG